MEKDKPKEMGIWDKIEKICEHPKYENYQENKFKINMGSFYTNLFAECEREKMVSYAQMLPLLQYATPPKEADYLIYMHPYARVEDRSEFVINQIRYYAEQRKEGAEIIVIGKACNAAPYLEDLENITYYPSHFALKLGERFGLDMKEEYVIYDNERKDLNIWPVDGCLNKCGFCRRTYMNIPFESQTLEFLKEQLDWFKNNHPDQMKNVCLRAENLTEYGLDIYGKQELHRVIDLVDSYEEVETIEIPIGLSIGEMTEEIIDALCRTDKIKALALNLEAGSNRMLKLVNKLHTREDAIYVYQRLREAHPDLWINTTLMLGLPTEEFQDIIELADLVEKTGPNQILCNYYGYSPQHPIASLPQISDSLREYHLKFFLQLLREKQRDRDLIVNSHAILKKGTRTTMRILAEVAEDQKYEHFLVYPGQSTLYKKNVESLDIGKAENSDVKKMIKSANGK